MMQDRDHALIQQSFADARAVREFDKSPIFYANFFKHAPDKRSMFREDISGQGMKFISTLQTIVHALDSPAKLDEVLGELAAGHAALGVKQADFDPMGEALIDTLRDVLGDRFTAEMESAWRNGFQLISERMTEIGKLT